MRGTFLASHPMHALLALTLTLTLTLSVPADAAEIDPVACANLRTRLKYIDARARLRSTQSLTDRRRAVKTRLYQLGCSEIGKPGER
jgi:hypothetical protein